MRKRLLALCLALVLCASPVLAAEEGFADVPSDAWYAPYVEACVEDGLMTGTGAGQFSPDRPLLLSECLVMAVRLYHLREDGESAIPPLPEDPYAYIRFFDADGAQVADLTDVESIYHEYGAVSVWFRQSPGPTELTLRVGFPGDRVETALTGSFRPGSSEVVSVLDGITVVRTEQDRYLFPCDPDSEIDYPFLLSCYSAVLPQLMESEWDRWYYPASYDLNFRACVDVLYGPRPVADTDEPAWREDFALLLWSVCGRPAPTQFAPVIPDVPASRYDPEQADAIRALYEAGILTGADDRGNFLGTATLTRAEAAAILARTLHPELRTSNQ